MLWGLLLTFCSQDYHTKTLWCKSEAIQAAICPLSSRAPYTSGIFSSVYFLCENRPHCQWPFSGSRGVSFWAIYWLQAAPRQHSINQWRMSPHCSHRQQTDTDCNLLYRSSKARTLDELRTSGCSPYHRACLKFQIWCLYSPGQICPKSLGQCILCVDIRESFQVSPEHTPCFLRGSLHPEWCLCEFTPRHVSHA